MSNVIDLDAEREKRIPKPAPKYFSDDVLYEAVTVAAEKCGMSGAEFIRRAVVDGVEFVGVTVPPIEGDYLRRLMRLPALCDRGGLFAN